jgi:hypothetical protein
MGDVSCLGRFVLLALFMVDVPHGNRASIHGISASQGVVSEDRQDVCSIVKRVE